MEKVIHVVTYLAGHGRVHGIRSQHRYTSGVDMIWWSALICAYSQLNGVLRRPTAARHWRRHGPALFVMFAAPRQLSLTNDRWRSASDDEHWRPSLSSRVSDVAGRSRGTPQAFASQPVKNHRNCAIGTAMWEKWNGPGQGASNAFMTIDGPRMSPLGDHTTRKYDKGYKTRGRETTWANIGGQDTIWQRTAQDSLTWRRHAEALAQPRDTIRLPNDVNRLCESTDTF